MAYKKLKIQFLMKKNSYDLLNKNEFLKINFERNSNKLNFGPKSLYFLFLIVLLILLNLFSYIKYQFFGQKSNIQKIISLLENNRTKYVNSLNYFNTKDFEIELNLDKYETNIYNNIKNKILSFPCREMWNNQREFLNGVVRRFKPKKFVEIGVEAGCSSSIILMLFKILMIHIYTQ